MKVSEVFLESLQIRDKLKLQNDFLENPIDKDLNPVLPFRITDDITLLIIGQDPTVKNAKSRRNIKYTLNLDKNGSLKNYINQICFGLGIKFENIYATNVFKYFYSRPPERTMNVLENHLQPNLDLLKKELSTYPKIPIITLGLLVLRLLTNADEELSFYWGYDKKSKKKIRDFDYCKKNNNELRRDLFPFPHQPSIIKKYYADNVKDYIKFMKSLSKFN